MVTINGKKLKNTDCYVIAEVGVNHILSAHDLYRAGFESPLHVAYRMIELANEAGVDAVKFQSFTAETLQLPGTNKPRYQIENTDETESYFDLIKGLEVSREDQVLLAKHCEKIGITFLSTPYDEESADFLDEVIQVPAFKLASIELNNHLLTRHVGRKGKPVILSTGLSEFADVQALVEIARKDGFADKLVLLQCTSNYPTQPTDIHLNVLKTYQAEFPDIALGFSDHSPSDTASIGAVALGAVLLEKHFTLDKNFEGPDHSSSLNPSELTNWVKNVREISASLGSANKQFLGCEKRNAAMRKYLVISPQKAGTVIETSMLRSMRTGSGVMPVQKNLNQIVGRTLKHDVTEPTPFAWEMIE